MKNKVLTSPFLVLYSLFAPSPILLPLFIFACIDNLPKNITSPIIVLLLHLVINVILVCIFNRAFILVNFSDANIYNEKDVKKGKNLQKSGKFPIYTTSG